jgi:3-hydroxybutyryl-CoA dehydratase
VSAGRDLLWGYFFEDVEVGDRIELGATLSEAHLLIAGGAFGDPGPNHLDEEHAAGGRFGTRVVHGPLSMGVMTSVLGQYFGQGIVALRDLSARFLAPVSPGDTLRCRWTVVAREERPHLSGGGLVTLEGAGSVRAGDERTVCLTCEATLAVGSRAVLAGALVERRA